MKLFPTKEKGKPKQPKGRPWALSKVLCRSNKKQQALPPPVPKTVATRRTTARTKSSSRNYQKNSLEARLLQDHAKSDSVNRNHWIPQPAPYDELLNHATHNRRTLPTSTALRNPKRQIPSYPRHSEQNRQRPEQTRTIDTRKSYQSSKRSEGSSCTTSLLDDTTLDSFSTGDDDGSTMVDTTVVSATQQGCQGCEDGNRELSLFLCGKILDQAGLRTPHDTREQQEAWDELILDLLLA